jgi:hypothetical protein
MGVQVAVPGGGTLLLPASGRVFGVIPVSGGENLSALKLVPEATGETVTLRLSPLFAGIERKLTCEQLWHFHSEPTVTLVGRIGDTLRLTGFERFELPRIEVQILRLKEGDLQGNSCACGQLVCHPRPAQCIGCGACGLCCLRP